MIAPNVATHLSQVIKTNCLTLNVTESQIETDRWTHIPCYRGITPQGDGIMSPRSKREYVEAVFLRYKQADKLARGRILDEFCATALIPPD